VLENFIGPIQKLQPSHILLLDAVVSVEHEAGEWLLLEPEDMESSFDSTHTLPFSLFAGMMGESPAIKGIGFVVETVTFGESMTPPASQAGLDLVTLLEHLLVGVSSDLLSRRPVCLAP